MTRIGILRTASLLLGFALVGCSSDSQTPASVSGKLMYNNQPIRAGTMHFHSPEGVAYSAQISPDGTYSATDLPTGEMTVTIETESINPNKQAGAGGKGYEAKRMQMMGQQKAPPGAGPTPSENYIKIPEKYGDPKKSPLKVPLEKGDQEHDFNLTD